MRSTLKLKQGGVLVIEARHTLKTVIVGNGVTWLHIPAELAAEFAQAVQLAGRAIELGPTRDIPAERGVRCHGDACCAGQHECPTPLACGVGS